MSIILFNVATNRYLFSCLKIIFLLINYQHFHESCCVNEFLRFPVNMPLVASIGPVLVRCWHYRPSTGPVLAHNGMIMVPTAVLPICSPSPGLLRQVPHLSLHLDSPVVSVRALARHDLNTPTHMLDLLLEADQS